jgi:hypothetical protein
MGVRVNLPPGCEGFNMEDGTRYATKAGGTVEVAEHHAKAVNRQIGGDAGLAFAGGFRGFLGTKKGRWCALCCRLWNAWNDTCPKCDNPTEAEAEAA